MQWFYSFMSRWPELHVVKPSSLSEQRARCASEESINKYFSELEHIITKYPLKDKPHLIYNIDEKGINTETRPPNVVAGKYYQPQMVIAETSELVTVIGAGNALGSSVPPFFVFPGQRMLPGLLEGKTVGADAEFSETPNPAYFYAYFCFCMRKISFRGFSFKLLPPDVQTELRRRTADFRNFFCPSKSIPEMSKNCQKARPLLTSCKMFAPPTYWKFAICVE